MTGRLADQQFLPKREPIGGLRRCGEPFRALKGEKDTEGAVPVQVGVDDGKQFCQREPAAVSGQIGCGIGGVQLAFVERRIGDDEIEFLPKCETADVARVSPEHRFPGALTNVLLQLAVGFEIELYAFDLTLVFLREHEHQQARAAADVQHAGPGRRFVREPGAQDAGVRTDFHGAAVLVDRELFELKIGVGHMANLLIPVGTAFIVSYPGKYYKSGIAGTEPNI